MSIKLLRSAVFKGIFTTVAAKKNATLILFANISAMEDRIFMKFGTKTNNRVVTYQKNFSKDLRIVIVRPVYILLLTINVSDISCQ